jgi:Smg protein
MKEDVLDVLMYLFEAYLDADPQPEPDRAMLRGELEQAGFGRIEIDHALEWLDGLSEEDGDNYGHSVTDRAIRVFSGEEAERLDVSCRGYLLYLEQIGILSAAQRELTIDRIMALGSEVDIEQIKWVVLLVLFTQPGQEAAYARMEDLIFEEGTAIVH